MDWKTASAFYEDRLTSVLEVYKYAVALGRLPQARVSHELLDNLHAEAEYARKQIKRLKSRQFKIAVVGLEKAGKSTFINAWLDCDLLPAKAARCTFTTTQIFSVANDREQRLEVKVKSEEQFKKLIGYLEEENAKEDLKTIEEYADLLRQVREDGDLHIPFSRLEEIKQYLTKYVADEKYAHSVLEARLYTSKLAQAEGIIFYDVPGLDSGLTKHVDEAREMLADCDAVILIQRFTSLREKELDIIKFTESGDINIPVSDKLFVFLSRIDAQATPQSLQQHVEEACSDWSKRTQLPRERIVYGSAGAYLVLNNLAEQQTQIEIGEANSIKAKLAQLFTDLNEDELVSNATGIELIKEKVFDYINSDRVSILTKRCETTIANIMNYSKQIYETVASKFPDDPEAAKKYEENKRRIDFSEWWQQQWQILKADLQQYFDRNVANINADSESFLVERLHHEYSSIVKSTISKLKEKALLDKELIFAANSNPVFDKANANFRWRENLYSDVRNTLDTIASQLALELQNDAIKFTDYMTGLLWGSKEVKERLVDRSSDYYLEIVKTSLSVLFLRFARPVAEALIRGPVNSDTRSEIVKTLGADIDIVDNYYCGELEPFRVLRRYVKYGPELIFQSETRQRLFGNQEIPQDLSDEIYTYVNSSPDALTPQDQVVVEVLSDLRAFEEYLLSAIFYAAGFESYFIQEIKGLVDSFRDKEGTWLGVATNEWLQENQLLLQILPPHLRTKNIDLEVSDRLRQLSISLKSFA
ncbi:dynamin family protein [Synechococcus elongatus IITB4]|uniref:dynamin family protein n=1 Tax=Synechococcus elongatus TaxID=32046 RepID=UPI0030CB76F3